MKDKEELIIVGIGASAGGLEALQGFVKNLPNKTNIAYILAQHLSPTYKSMMVDLLSKDSTIDIKEAENQEEIKPNTMYICPPNKNIIVEENKILIIDPKQLTYGPKPSINILFESIASNKEEKSIGIILSGTGSDGSRGIRAIKAEGGFTIVQQPQNAKYDGMPNSAINTGNVDLILDVEVMGNEIVELLNYPNKAESLNNLNDKALLYRNILSRLKRNKQIDFSLYKSTTIQRRIERRMAALKLTNLKDYSEYLFQKNNEVDELFKDILIGVTSFFRDSEAFMVLKNHLTDLIEKKEDSTIRIWTPGCSTGEEAYSIAIILSEILGNKVVNYKIQIFATDIDEEATRFARAGRYPESTLINVDKNYVKKYFTVKNDEYEVIKPIRDMCIFSRHDITNDPAFMRLDLISCRNLLIYFTNELQQRIFPMFHYSLNDDAILFLGKSESIGSFNHQFKIIDKKWKIYKAIYLGQKSAPTPLRAFDKTESYQPPKAKIHNNTPTVSELMIEHIQRYIMPLCIVVNDSFDMIYIKGDNPYLKRPDGEISQNVFKNVKSELSVELRAALHTSKKEGQLIKTSFQKVVIEKEIRYIRMIATPLDNSLTSNLFLVCFQEEQSDILNSINPNQNNFFENDEELQRLELELTKTKEHLQTVIEELETSNEEMQSLNEELQSSNEELQSSNEELETTNEELQSTNEELQTAYTEMRAMYEERDKDTKQILQIKEELEEANNRFIIVNSTAKVGIFDIDIINNNILFINEQWASIFGLSIQELKKYNLPEWFESRIHKDDFEKRQNLFEQLLLGKIKDYELELRVLHKNGNYIWVRCFSTSIVNKESKKVIRVLGTLKDIQLEKEQTLKNEILQSKLNNAIDIANIGTWEWDIQSDNIWWSESMYDIFVIPKDAILNLETVRNTIVEEDKLKHEAHVNESIKNGIEHNLTFKINTINGIKDIWAKGKVLYDTNHKPQKMVGVVQDITSNYLKEIELKQKNLFTKSILETSFNGVYIYNFETNLNNYINPEYTKITGYTLNELNSLKKEDFLKLFHPDDLENVLNHMKEVRMSKNSVSYEIRYKFKHKNGHFIKLISRDCIVLYDIQNNGLEMLGTFKEIKDE